VPSDLEAEDFDLAWGGVSELPSALLASAEPVAVSRVAGSLFPVVSDVGALSRDDVSLAAAEASSVRRGWDGCALELS
jgi:hypothetical protein